MASDNLNEVGKYIKKTRTNADYAIKKMRPHRPTVERTRDIFDVDIPFEMQFDVKPNQKSVSLDLEFNKPPPLSNCFTDVDCPRTTCETFTLSSGEHEITLQYGIHPINELFQIYVNGEAWPETQYTRLTSGDLDDPAVILVTNLPFTLNTVVICYTIYCLGELYTGQAFGALLRAGGTGWEYNGNQPPAGWYGEPPIGPIHYEDTSIVIEQSMFIRIEARGNYALVPGSVNAVLNWAVIPYQEGALYFPAGLYYTSNSGVVLMDITTYAPAGTRITGALWETSPPPAGGWGAAGWSVNTSWIRVGRLRTHFPEGYLEGLYGYWDGADACTQGDCP